MPVKVNNPGVGQVINTLIDNQIFALDCLETLQPVLVVNPSETAAAGYTRITDGSDTLAIESNGSINVNYPKLEADASTYVGRSTAGTTTYTVAASTVAYLLEACVYGTGGNAGRVEVDRTGFTGTNLAIADGGTGYAATGTITWNGVLKLVAGDIVRVSNHGWFRYVVAAA